MGRNNLSWKTNMIVPKGKGSLKVSVMDRDLKYDDLVGDVTT